MNQYGWHDCPAPIRSQVETFVQACVALLGANMRGVYLHGSLAMGCFNPERSDLDLLIVTHVSMDIATKRRVAELVLMTSNTPHPLELSFVRTADINPWQYPTPFDFHYSEGWRERITQELATDDWQLWNDTTSRDPDLAAHVTITLTRGVALVGPLPQEVFPPVPRNDYVDSIWLDVEGAATYIDTHAVYGTLNLCRVYAFVRDGLVYSKDEGGVWALDVLTARFRPLVDEALAAYRGEREDDTIDRQEITVFVRFMLDEIARYKGEP